MERQIKVPFRYNVVPMVQQIAAYIYRFFRRTMRELVTGELYDTTGTVLPVRDNAHTPTGNRLALVSIAYHPRSDSSALELFWTDDELSSLLNSSPKGSIDSLFRQFRSQE